MQSSALRIGVNSLCLLAMFYAASAPAQQSQGNFTGSVTDPSGAPIPDARVTAVEQGTGFRRAAETDTDGVYYLPLLPPGRYTITVSKPGFTTDQEGPLLLTVDRHAKVDIRLQLGSSTTLVTVRATEPLLETQSAAVGTTVGQEKISQLPFNGRQFLEATLFTPGVVPGSQGSELNDNRGGSIAANGLRETMNSFLLDGMNNTSVGVGTFTATPPLDAIQEFRMETAVYSAKFGTSAGVQVNMVTKSGTNRLHGSLYDYFRNASLDTRNFFEPFVPPFQRNEYGATLGGPVVIPGVYNGHDHTFFFLAYEGLQDNHTFFSRGLVPTTAERNGDFSGLLNPSCPQPTVLIDPLVLVDPAAPVTFGNNLNALAPLLPSRTLDPVGRKIADLYPSPNILNATCGAPNYSAPNKQRVYTNAYDGRFDHRWGMTDSMFYRYNLTTDSNFLPFNNTQLPGYGMFQADWFTATGVDWTHTFSPTVLNEAKVDYNRWQYHWNNEGQGISFASQAGLEGEALNAFRDTGVPDFSFAGGYTPLGAATNLPQAGAVNTFEYADTLTQVHGNHTLAYGVDIHSVKRGNFFIDENARSTFSFNGILTGCPPLPQLAATCAAIKGGIQQQLGTPNVVFGNGLADALLGVPTSWVNGYSQYISGAGGTDDFFAQDDWKVRPNLTLNLGLRYEYDALVTDKYNHFGGFDFNTGQVMVAGPVVGLESFAGIISPTGTAIGKFVPAGSLNLGSTANNRALQTPDWHSFAPRFGFAWQPTANSHTVIRGGYGIYYDAMVGELYFQKSANPPFVQVSAGDLIDSPQVLGGIISGELPLGTGAVMQSALTNTNAIFPALNPVQINLQNSMVQEWSLDVQRTLPGLWLLDVGYVGTRGLYLPFLWNPNQNTPVCPTLSTCTNQRAYPNFLNMTYTASDGASIYHSLQVKVERRYSNGLSFIGAYTWSKSIDTNSTYFSTDASQNLPQNSFDRAAEKGLSDFNIPQRLSLAYIYDLPFGSKIGKLNSSVANVLIEGWQVSGIATLQSGSPFTAYYSQTDPSHTEQGTERPNIVPGVPLYPAHQTVTEWMNPAAFSLPAPYTFGSAGRDILQGPGLADWDLSLIREFRLAESKTLEFRAEAFNLFNSPNFSLPAADPSAPTFGQIFNTVQPIAGLASGGPGDPREIQLVLRIKW
jgi:Carboxypeptidase regulatory-like domain